MYAVRLKGITSQRDGSLTQPKILRAKLAAALARALAKFS